MKKVDEIKKLRGEVEHYRRTVEAMREKNRELRQRLEDVYRGAEELNRQVDAILAAAVMRCGTEGVLSLPYEELRALDRYEVSAERDDGAGAYVVRVKEKATKEGEA